MDDQDNLDVLVRYQRLALERRARRRGAVRAMFGAFTGNPAALPPDMREHSIQEQLLRQQAEQNAPSVPVPINRDPMIGLREREQNAACRAVRSPPL